MSLPLLNDGNGTKSPAEAGQDKPAQGTMQKLQRDMLYGDTIAGLALRAVIVSRPACMPSICVWGDPRDAGSHPLFRNRGVLLLLRLLQREMDDRACSAVNALWTKHLSRT